MTSSIEDQSQYITQISDCTSFAPTRATLAAASETTAPTADGLVKPEKLPVLFDLVGMWSTQHTEDIRSGVVQLALATRESLAGSTCIAPWPAVPLRTLARRESSTVSRMIPYLTIHTLWRTS